jgi:hypothetical protein
MDRGGGARLRYAGKSEKMISLWWGRGRGASGAVLEALEILMMEKPGDLRDVDRIMDRLMIDLYKGQIRRTRLDPRALKGSWDEACTILEIHFGRIGQVVQSNEVRLLSLYQAALRELRDG